MDADQPAETTMDPRHRTLPRVLLGGSVVGITAWFVLAFPLWILVVSDHIPVIDFRPPHLRGPTTWPEGNPSLSTIYTHPLYTLAPMV